MYRKVSRTKRQVYLSLATVLVIGGITAIATRDSGWSGAGLIETLGSMLAIGLGLVCLKKAAKS
jgi:hypothetical protein